MYDKWHSAISEGLCLLLLYSRYKTHGIKHLWSPAWYNLTFWYITSLTLRNRKLHQRCLYVYKRIRNGVVRIYLILAKFLSMKVMFQSMYAYCILLQRGGLNTSSITDILLLNFLLYFNSVRVFGNLFLAYSYIFRWLQSKHYYRMLTFWVIESCKPALTLYLLSKSFGITSDWKRYFILVVYKALMISVFWKKESRTQISNDISGMYWERLLQINLLLSDVPYKYNVSYRVPKGAIRPDFLIHCGLNAIVLDAKNVWSMQDRATIQDAVKEMLYRNYPDWIPLMVRDIVLVVPDYKTETLIEINQELRDIKLPIIAITGYETWLISPMKNLTGILNAIVLIMLFTTWK